MLEQSFREGCQRYLLDPAMPWLSKWTSPIGLTLASGCLGILCSIAIVANWPMTATILLLFSGWLDMADGSLARYQNKPSSLGAALDIFVDRVVECAVVVALFLQFPPDRGLMCLLMFASMLLCITSFLVVGIFTENQTQKSFHYSPGLMERAEAFIFFIMMIFLPQYFTILAISFSLLVLWTGIYRIFEFIQVSRQTSQ
ncbi:CDP-alcohol phosphatidyltransferase family protein [Legionella sp. W05-934-2]|jgi:phosphatidylglycerophosphate synthase|uniref:CDP-alcohol phosphatidyltransferase family protein n=1 Tax=Legionella sp. W05-934-2 TaxID=1198649 RepID=UPI003461D20E